MIHPRIDELLDNVDSRYALVIVAAKRARQINNYHHQLGEGTFDQFLPPLIESRSKRSRRARSSTRTRSSDDESRISSAPRRVRAFEVPALSQALVTVCYERCSA